MKLRIMRDTPFATIQGEGMYVGWPSTFLRLAGCDLRCHRILNSGKHWSCDEPKALADYSVFSGKFLPVVTKNAVEVDVYAVADQVAKLDQPHLVITGGEPMLQGDAVAQLLSILPSRVSPTITTIESNARHTHDSVAQKVSLMSLSPKIQSMEGQLIEKFGIDLYAEPDKFTLTQEAGALEWWLRRSLTYRSQIQIKVVCASADDYKLAREVFAWARTLHEGVDCIVSPADVGEAWDQAPLVAAVLADKGLSRVIPQTHKMLGIK